MTTLAVVLVSPRNPLNIGAAARAMSNFGFTDLRLVDAYDVAFREAKSAVGAGPVLKAAREFATIAEAVADCTIIAGTTGGEHREPSLPLRRLEYGARRARTHGGKAAFLFGSEKYGLSNDDISHCDMLLQIPSRPEHRSMNLGQSVAVCLYEIIRSPAAVRRTPLARQSATAGQQELLRTRLEEALRLSGYYDSSATAGAERRLRSLIKRMHLTQQDSVIWLGILRQILWRMRQ